MRPQPWIGFLASARLCVLNKDWLSRQQSCSWLVTLNKPSVTSPGSDIFGLYYDDRTSTFQVARKKNFIERRLASLCVFKGHYCTLSSSAKSDQFVHCTVQKSLAEILVTLSPLLGNTCHLEVKYYCRNAKLMQSSPKAKLPSWVFSDQTEARLALSAALLSENYPTTITTTEITRNRKKEKNRNCKRWWCLCL